MKNNKKGFTLVELSIVLVIIGLLIGGILVAQSMIGTAKIQALSRQIGQYDAAVANFYTKFNAIPGDSKLINNLAGTAGLGDGNGTITSGGSASTITEFSGEIRSFFPDLSSSGLQNEAGAAFVAGTGAISTTNVPSAKAGTNANFVAYGVSGANFYSIGRATSAATTPWAITQAAAFKPADALALDTKLDDGAGGTGTVQASVGGATLAKTPGAACAATTTPFAYAVATTPAVDACVIDVRMGVSTGMMN